MKKIIPFIGRQNELHKLEDVSKQKVASLMVLKGRRRVGKSRLITEYAKKKHCISITGLPPAPETTAQDQRNEFTRQLAAQLKLPPFQIEDWGDIFDFLANQVKNKPTIILLDEISWMGSKDPNFLGKLKIVWDVTFSQNPNIMMVLCGSVSSWIDKNILSSTGFFGRIALQMKLEPLNISESCKLLEAIGFKQSMYEKFTLLCITGGIPRYIELINPLYPAAENIKQLCFKPHATLLTEFQYIFHDLFSRRSSIYEKIVETLKNGPQDFDSIAKQLNYSASGQLTEYLDELTQAGFISRDYTWHIGKGVYSSLSRFRLCDNYLRFYLKYLKPNRQKIESQHFKDMDPASLPGFKTWMGLQFENLVLSNRDLIINTLKIDPTDIIADNPFFQNKTTRSPGCQIDYLIHTRQKTLYLIEIKFSQNAIKTAILDEIQTKMKALKTPKSYSILPVIVYIGELPDSVESSELIYRTINFMDYIK